MQKHTELIWQEVMEEKGVHEFQDWLSERTDMPEFKSIYAENRREAPVCCPSCLEPIQAPYIQCPKCSLTLDVSIMDTLRDNAFELAAYAWNYRNTYEKDIEEGKIYQGKASVHYSLPPPEGWLVYLASIVLAAILGGLSYDAFKKALSKLRGNFRNLFSKELPREKELRQFYSNLREYFLGRRNPDSPIFRAYVQELIKISILRSYYKGLSDFEIHVNEIIEKAKESRVSEIDISESVILAQREPPSDVEVREQVEEVLKQSIEMESRIKHLQEYLKQINSGKINDQGIKER